MFRTRSSTRPQVHLLLLVLLLTMALFSCGAVTESNVTKTQGGSAGAFVFVAGEGQTSGFRMDPATGALTPLPGSPFTGVLQPTSIVPVADGTALALVSGIVGAQGTNNLVLFNIDPVTGQLTPGPGTFIPGQPAVVAANAAGNTLFIGGTGTEGTFLQGFSVSGAGFAPLPGAPFTGSANFTGPLLSLNLNTAGNSLSVIVGGATGNLFGTIPLLPGGGFGPPVIGDPVAGGFGPGPVLVHPEGRLAFVATTDGLAVFLLDATTGRPTQVDPGVDFQFPPRALAIDPSGRFLVAAGGTNQVTVFSIDGNTGTLQPVTGSPTFAGAEPVAVEFDPSGRFLLVLNRGSNNLSVFGFDRSSGALTAVPGSPFAVVPGATSLAVVPARQ